MARVNIEDCWWTDPRRSALIRLVGDEELADGAATKMWRLAQEFWKRNRGVVPVQLFKTLRFSEHLLGVCLAELREDGVYVRGSSAYLDWVHEKREAGRSGGKKSAQRPRDAKGRLVKESKQDPSSDQAESKQIQPSVSSSSSSSDSFSVSGSEKSSDGLEIEPRPSGAVWDAYREAYRSRYGEDPVRNAQVNSQIKQFVSRVPAGEAPEIARFYLSHNESYYVKRMHPVGLMLQDAEKLRTEWITGTRMTGGKAKEVERKQEIFETWAPFIAEAEARE